MLLEVVFAFDSTADRDGGVLQLAFSLTKSFQPNEAVMLLDYIK